MVGYYTATGPFSVAYGQHVLKGPKECCFAAVKRASMHVTKRTSTGAVWQLVSDIVCPSVPMVSWDRR